MAVWAIRAEGGCVAPGEYPVVVQDAQFASPRSVSFQLPAKTFTNLKSDGHPKIEPDMGLEKITYGGGWDEDDNYFLDDHQDASVYMECNKENSGLDEPLCKANVYFWKVQFGFRFFFPAGERMKWRDNIDAVEQLMTGWEIK